jgi:PadR family transcriptional regulator PadR
MRARGGRGARHRHMLRPGHWGVRARVERFSEPALLLLLRERPAHGYELLEALPALTGESRVDMGNLYRVLRALEEDGLVTSRWESGEPGPTKRIYELTPEGARLLDEWAAALRRSRERTDGFFPH